MVDNKKYYTVLYGVDNNDILGCHPWLPYDQVVYEKYDEAYSRMLDIKEQFPDRTWAVYESVGLGPGIIKVKI